MPASSNRQARDRPENLVRSVTAKLRYHILWDSLCICIPPVAAAAYVVLLLFQTARLGESATIVSETLVGVLGLWAIVRRYRPLVPNVSVAAQMVDQQAGAKDHFLTLSTLDPENCPPSLWSRLYRDAAGFVDRRRDRACSTNRRGPGGGPAGQHNHHTGPGRTGGAGHRRCAGAGSGAEPDAGQCPDPLCQSGRPA